MCTNCDGMLSPCYIIWWITWSKWQLLRMLAYEEENLEKQKHMVIQRLGPLIIWGWQIYFKRMYKEIHTTEKLMNSKIYLHTYHNLLHLNLRYNRLWMCVVEQTDWIFLHTALWISKCFAVVPQKKGQKLIKTNAMH